MNRANGMTSKFEIVTELKSLQDEIMEACRHAMELVRDAKGDRSELDRRTWFAHIEMSIMNDTQWLGGSTHTLQDTIDELEEDSDIEDENEDNARNATDRANECHNDEAFSDLEEG